MIDHISIGVDDVTTAKDFYDRVFSQLGYGLLAEVSGLLAYGENTIQFLVMQPFNGAPAGAGNGAHFAFKAKSKEQVDAFHAVALNMGATCEGAPGTRAYPHDEVYAAYVRDPFGHKLEVLVNGFAV